MKRTFTLALFSAFAFGAPLLATDGVVEINQTRILASGGHFPYVISQPGSYRLTSNLDVILDATNPATAQNRMAIQVDASDVSIDLNGFTISGPAVCQGTPPICSVVGSGHGIRGASIYPRLSIKNGTIRGMGSAGIYAFDETQIDHVRTIGNGSYGMQVGNGSIVSFCEASLNNVDGLVVTGTGDVVVKSSAFRDNGNDGVNVANGLGSISGSMMLFNAHFGLACVGVCGYVGNVLELNNGGAGQPQASGGAQLGANLCNGSTICP